MILIYLQYCKFKALRAVAIVGRVITIQGEMQKWNDNKISPHKISLVLVQYFTTRWLENICNISHSKLLLFVKLLLFFYFALFFSICSLLLFVIVHSIVITLQTFVITFKSRKYCYHNSWKSNNYIESNKESNEPAYK